MGNITLKGWRTILANVAMCAGLVTGHQLDPAMVQQNLDAIFILVATVNAILRYITTTSVGKGQ